MALAREWEELVDRVRELDGFEDFLRPPPLDSLLGAAANGPVVVVNVSRWRCDALIVRSDGVEPIGLPELTADEVASRTATYLAALRDGVDFAPGMSFTAALEARARARSAREAVLRSTVEWLWDAVADPVLTALGITDAPARPTQRLWWCPTGLLTLLPLHGAGHHHAGDGRTVVDRVVSSYTPTLRVLSRLVGERDAGPAAPLLFVGVPDSPGMLSLTQDVERERDFLRSTFPGGVTVVEGPAATVAAVREQMLGHRCVHLSCHGYQDLNDPSAAGFVLTDGTLTIVRLSAVQYEGDFAFLSACRTAAGGVHLPDEVITLAAALNYSGYRHVVATLWSVDPAVAADMTTAFYPHLMDGDVFVPARSAVALHAKTREMRDAGILLDDWLPFTHTGP
ncbi:CHAT domain-containing protein [Amycolatopsis sp. CA-126428]|uniref:CHAT domain-containing protein n=1 Tax=Amycolatopsis sp. CA-126428 TaxID=2073158 RepID=UPI000CCFE293|nr:CHAT domain-containing protein [Amycolatopsis sp. CA-126428]